jgi:hypothetical protein
MASREMDADQLLSILIGAVEAYDLSVNDEAEATLKVAADTLMCDPRNNGEL